MLNASAPSWVISPKLGGRLSSLRTDEVAKLRMKRDVCDEERGSRRDSMIVMSEADGMDNDK